MQLFSRNHYNFAISPEKNVKKISYYEKNNGIIKKYLILKDNVISFKNGFP